MKCLLVVLSLSFTLIASAQSNRPIAIIDFVKVINNHHQEAIYFYENNWKVYREIALKRGYIKSYKIIKTAADSTSDFDLLLMTEYANNQQQKEAEEKFQLIIKEIRPNGPLLLNGRKPNEFRKNIFLKRAEIVFSSEAK